MNAGHFTAGLLLTAIFWTPGHVSAREFTVECMKNQLDKFLCASDTPERRVGPAGGHSGQAGRSRRRPDRTGGSVLPEDTPDRRVGPTGGLTGHVGCAMSCTLDERCRHFNHVLNDESLPCQLFYTQPTAFTVVDGCDHYRSPSTRAFSSIANLYYCLLYTSPSPRDS